MITRRCDVSCRSSCCRGGPRHYQRSGGSRRPFAPTGTSRQVDRWPPAQGFRGGKNGCRLANTTAGRCRPHDSQNHLAARAQQIRHGAYRFRWGAAQKGQQFAIEGQSLTFASVQTRSQEWAANRVPSRAARAVRSGALRAGALQPRRCCDRVPGNRRSDCGVSAVAGAPPPAAADAAATSTVGARSAPVFLGRVGTSAALLDGQRIRLGRGWAWRLCGPNRRRICL